MIVVDQGNSINIERSSKILRLVCISFSIKHSIAFVVILLIQSREKLESLKCISESH